MKKIAMSMAALVMVFVVDGAAFADLNDGLVAHYPFNGNAQDMSGNGNHGMVNGPVLTKDRLGKSASAYEFDGSDDYIEIPDAPSLDIANEITLSAWIKLDVLDNGKGARQRQAIISKYNAAANIRAFEIGFNDYNNNWSPHKIQLTISAKNSPFNGGVLNSNITLNKNTWYHIVGVLVPGASMKIYINGVEQTGNMAYGSLPAGIAVNDQSILIGNDHDAEGTFDGGIDDIRIYNRALSESEIGELYNIGQKDKGADKQSSSQAGVVKTVENGGDNEAEAKALRKKGAQLLREKKQAEALAVYKKSLELQHDPNIEAFVKKLEGMVGKQKAKPAPAVAAATSSMGPFEGYAEAGGDINHPITITRDGSLTFTASGGKSLMPGGYPSSVQLFAADSATRIDNYVHFNENNSKTIADLAPGTYYLRLHTSKGFGKYTIRSSFTNSLNAGTETEGNNSIDTANEFSSNPMTGTIGYSNKLKKNDGNYYRDVDDYFSLFVPEGGSVTFDVVSSDNSLMPGGYGSSLILYTPDGAKQIKEIYLDQGNSATVKKLSSGVYFFRVRVSTYARGHGSYSIRYSLDGS